MDTIHRDLPLLDLHRHLEGSVRPESVFDLAARHGVPLPAADPESFRPYVQVSAPQPGLLAFFEKFDWVGLAFVDPAACYRVAAECVEDAAAEGIDYLELRFSPGFMARRHGLDPAAVVEAVVAGADDGRRRTGIAVGVIGIISRTYGPDAGRRELDALLTRRDDIVALDLAGDEVGFPPVHFAEHFRRAREVGWGITVHAGEVGAPESVWGALRHLAATRIGHGITALADPALVAHMVEQGIGVEVSLTSNVQISAVPGYAAHPLKRMLDAGLRVTLNTDDPAISGIDLRHEYRVAAPAAGLSRADIRRLQTNALDLAFLDEGAKQALSATAARRTTDDA